MQDGKNDSVRMSQGITLGHKEVEQCTIPSPKAVLTSSPYRDKCLLVPHGLPLSSASIADLIPPPRRPRHLTYSILDLFYP